MRVRVRVRLRFEKQRADNKHNTRCSCAVPLSFPHSSIILAFSLSGKPSQADFLFLFFFHILFYFECTVRLVAEKEKEKRLWTSNLESIHLFVCRFFSIQNFLLLWYLLWPRVLTCTAQTLFCYCCIKIIQCSFNLLEIMIFFILFLYRDFDTIFVFISSKQLSV